MRKDSLSKWLSRVPKKKLRNLDAIVHDLHEKAFSHIDCLKCANCCKTTGPLFTLRDITRISLYLKITPQQFEEKYLRVDEDKDKVLQQLPCPFLGADNYCSIYAVRPEACADYPHTLRSKQHTLLNLMDKNAEICPAVDEITTELRKIFSNPNVKLPD